MLDNDALVICCPVCLRRSRVPRARLADVPVCSHCRAHLLPDRPVVLTAESFDAYVGGTDLPIAIDFWAPWCGPCRTMAPQFAAATPALQGRALLAKVDTEAAPGLAARFAIQSIPTLVLLRSGRELARTSGAMGTAAIVDWVGRAL